MLEAIGIYEEVIEEKKPDSNEKIKLKRTQTAQKYRNDFFQINQLENADKILLSTEFFSAMDRGFIYKIESYDENKTFKEINYIYRSALKNTAIVIATKKPLDEKEQIFLMRNIEHTLVRPDSVKITIRNILDNPLGYTGTDKLIMNTQDKTKEVIKVMHDNLEKVIERGETLDELQNKTIRLDETAAKFDNSSKRLNRTCCWH